jgi:RHS repeat-associated protein
VTYTYDVEDRRIAMTANGVTALTAYDGVNVWADYDAAGQVKARYPLGDKIDQMLARFRPEEGTTWYLADKLGTVRDLINAAGQHLNHIEYGSFGNVLTQTNPAAGDRFLFTGGEFNPRTGAYYYRARYYDPVAGRFIGRDPRGLLAGDTNLYRYVRNHVLDALEPSGTLEEEEYAIVAQVGASESATIGDVLVTIGRTQRTQIQIPLRDLPRFLQELERTPRLQTLAEQFIDLYTPPGSPPFGKAAIETIRYLVILMRAFLGL